MSGIYSSKIVEETSEPVAVSFTNYTEGVIPETDTKGTYVRADANLTLPPAIAGKHLNIFAGSSISDTFEEIQTITGGYTNEWVGYSSCISTDGSVFAYGAYRAKPNDVSSSGYTKIYRKDAAGVYQVEQTIEGIYRLQQAGSKLDINGEGTRIAIASNGWANNNTQPVLPDNLEHGFVDVYDYSSGTWTKTFTVETTANGNSRMGVSISKDGNTLIMSKPQDSSSRGYVKVYYYDGTNWSQKGSTLVGSASNESFGTDVDVNEDGTRIAIGQTKYTSSNTGRVQIFTFNGTSWVQYGNDMSSSVGETGEEFGRVIKLNSLGTRIVIGSPKKDTTNTDAGVAVVYEDQNGTWTQIGSSLSGKDTANDLFGWIVDITDDGNTIIVGPRYNYEGQSERRPGYARFYKWNGSDWETTQTINPPSGETNSTLIHSLSRDGAYFVYALPYHNTQTGKIILYNKESLNVGTRTITAKTGDKINNGTSITVSTLKKLVCKEDGKWVSN